MIESKTLSGSNPRVKTPYKFDEGPGRYRIGALILSNDYVTERDFMNMRPSDDVAIYVSRLPNTDECTVETLQYMAEHITAATSLLIPGGRLDVVAYGCTSGTVVMGYERICSYVRAARPGVPCVTPITASLEALDSLGAAKLAILTPYTDDVNARLSEYVVLNGKRVTGLTSFHIERGDEMARLPAEAIYYAAVEADRAEADAVFISCTAIRAVDVVERIERRIGKPVVTANQALFWHALRTAGYSKPVLGYGRLLTLGAGSGRMFQSA